MVAKKVKENRINTVISGVTGKMGSELLTALTRRSEIFCVTGGLCRESSKEVHFNIDGKKRLPSTRIITSTSLEEVEKVDLIIDFSEPNFSLQIMKDALERKVPILIGTTGHSEDQIREVEAASSNIPILLAANTSIGIAFIKKLLTLSREMLSAFEIKRIYEKHHLEKKDSPSGTALDLSSLLKELSNFEYDISIESERNGESAGEHSIILERKNLRSEAGERIEITHKAQDRSIFAEGALLAAQWLVSQKKGLYSMTDFYLP